MAKDYIQLDMTIVLNGKMQFILNEISLLFRDTTDKIMLFTCNLLVATFPAMGPLCSYM